MYSNSFELHGTFVPTRSLCGWRLPHSMEISEVNNGSGERSGISMFPSSIDDGVDGRCAVVELIETSSAVDTGTNDLDTFSLSLLKNASELRASLRRSSRR